MARENNGMLACWSSDKLDSNPNWIIPTAASLVHFWALGVQYSFGLYFLPIAKECGSNRATTAWTVSLMARCMLGAGFPTGALFNRYDACVLSVGFFLQQFR